MFDVGFSELLVIGVVALIVIGPERLPRVARMIGHLMGRMQRYVADAKADIDREIELEELRKMRDSVQEAATTIETSVQAELNKAETELNQAAESAAGVASGSAPEVSPAPASSASAQVSPAQETAPAIVEKSK